jgi:D-alanyl-lipoteichoic acid acyltransferase DltB (MBOAT superfamily)
MLFNSAIFIFAFLPLVLLGYRGLLAIGLVSFAKLWLVVASLYFYAYWKLEYLPILLVSIVLNYLLGKQICRHDERAGWVGSKGLLVVGLVFNLGLLGYFKYTGFLLGIVAALGGGDFSFDALVLPLAISFFTFQQIAYLVDCHRDKASEYRFINYCVFVSFFPQLIAGPIVHHSQMMPQFERLSSGQGSSHASPMALQGLVIFSIGLFKKVCVADSFAVFADVGYASTSLSLAEAWMTSLSYTFQLYYDFSGYSDMAIGAALLFGIRLPVNFLSPYRAGSIREFWRRWHITLSNWLRDYVFIPLGGSRLGMVLNLRNLLITFVVGGIWHGAGWTFVLWGALHGLAMLAHRLWAELDKPMPYWLGWFLTFNFVNITWVFFRAPDLASAIAILAAMFNPADIEISSQFIYGTLVAAENPLFAALMTALGGAVVWIMPIVIAVTVAARNTIELSGYSENTVNLTSGRVIVTALGFTLAALFILSGNPSAFLYFNF